MTTAAPSTALATIQPAFTDAERLALAGYLAGYRGLTREAYALDLRQFTTWCRARSLALFAVRRGSPPATRNAAVAAWPAQAGLLDATTPDGYGACAVPDVAVTAGVSTGTQVVVALWNG